MSAAVDIETNRKMTLSIPIQCVTTRTLDGLEKQEVAFIYQTDSSTVKIVPVSTGIQDKQYIEIITGVDSAQIVVTAPFSAIAKDLTNSQKVTKK